MITISLTGKYAKGKSYLIFGSLKSAYINLNIGPHGDKKCCSCLKSSGWPSVVVRSPHDRVPWGPKMLSISTGKKLWSSGNVPLSNSTVNSAHLVRIGRLSAC